HRDTPVLQLFCIHTRGVLRVSPRFICLTYHLMVGITVLFQIGTLAPDWMLLRCNSAVRVNASSVSGDVPCSSRCRRALLSGFSGWSEPTKGGRYARMVDGTERCRGDAKIGRDGKREPGGLLHWRLTHTHSQGIHPFHQKYDQCSDRSVEKHEGHDE